MSHGEFLAITQPKKKRNKRASSMNFVQGLGCHIYGIISFIVTERMPSHRLKFLNDSLGFDFFGMLNLGHGSVRFQQCLSGGIG